MLQQEQLLGVQSGGNAKWSLPTLLRRIVGVGVQLHPFLTLVLDGGEWSAFAAAA